MNTLTFDSILSNATEIFGITRHQMLGRGRTVDICRARFAVAWVLREEFRLHPEDIGQRIGGRTRTAILAAIGQATNWRDIDLTYRRETDRLRDATQQLRLRRAA